LLPSEELETVDLIPLEVMACHSPRMVSIE
jgi:hypothetical protein